MCSIKKIEPLVVVRCIALKIFSFDCHILSVQFLFLKI